MAKEIHEVFTMVGATRKKAEKLRILKENDHQGLRDVLRGYFDERIQWRVPLGDPPYTPNEVYNYPSNLLREHLKFKYIANTKFSKDMPKFKRERMYVEILEGVHPEDAKIVVNMVNREKIKGITKDLVKEAFPGLLPD